MPTNIYSEPFAPPSTGGLRRDLLPAPRGIRYMTPQVAPASFEEQDVAAMARDAENNNPFTRGLRSGLYGVGGTAGAFAANVGEAAGLDTSGMWKNAQQNMRLAGAAAPAVTDYKDVNSLSSLGHYVLGGMGSALATTAPALIATPAVGALAGGLRGAAFLGGAASMLPQEAGETALELKDQAPNMGAGERLRHSLVKGGINAALEEAVPFALMRRGATRMAPPKGALGYAGNIAKETGAGMLGEGATEGMQSIVGNEVMNHALPGRDRSGDMHEVLNSAFLGMAGGMGMSAPAAIASNSLDALQGMGGKVAELGGRAAELGGKAVDKGVEFATGQMIPGVKPIVEAATSAYHAVRDVAAPLGTAFAAAAGQTDAEADLGIGTGIVHDAVKNAADTAVDGTAALAKKVWGKVETVAKNVLGIAPELAAETKDAPAASSGQLETDILKDLRGPASASARSKVYYDGVMKNDKVPQAFKDVLAGVGTDRSSQQFRATVAGVRKGISVWHAAKENGTAFLNDLVAEYQRVGGANKFSEVGTNLGAYAEDHPFAVRTNALARKYVMVDPSGATADVTADVMRRYLTLVVGHPTPVKGGALKLVTRLAADTGLETDELKPLLKNLHDLAMTEFGNPDDKVANEQLRTRLADALTVVGEVHNARDIMFKHMPTEMQDRYMKMLEDEAERLMVPAAQREKWTNQQLNIAAHKMYKNFVDLTQKSELAQGADAQAGWRQQVNEELNAINQRGLEAAQAGDTAGAEKARLEAKWYEHDATKAGARKSQVTNDLDRAFHGLAVQFGRARKKGGIQENAGGAEGFMRDMGKLVGANATAMAQREKVEGQGALRADQQVSAGEFAEDAEGNPVEVAPSNAMTLAFDEAGYTPDSEARGQGEENAQDTSLENGQSGSMDTADMVVYPRDGAPVFGRGAADAVAAEMPKSGRAEIVGLKAFFKQYPAGEVVPVQAEMMAALLRKIARELPQMKVDAAEAATPEQAQAAAEMVARYEALEEMAGELEGDPARFFRKSGGGLLNDAFMVVSSQSHKRSLDISEAQFARMLVNGRAEAAPERGEISINLANGEPAILNVVKLVARIMEHEQPGDWAPRGAKSEADLAQAALMAGLTSLLDQGYLLASDPYAEASGGTFADGGAKRKDRGVKRKAIADDQPNFDGALLLREAGSTAHAAQGEDNTGSPNGLTPTHKLGADIHWSDTQGYTPTSPATTPVDFTADEIGLFSGKLLGGTDRGIVQGALIPPGGGAPQALNVRHMLTKAADKIGATGVHDALAPEGRGLSKGLAANLMKRALASLELAGYTFAKGLGPHSSTFGAAVLFHYGPAENRVSVEAKSVVEHAGEYKGDYTGAGDRIDTALDYLKTLTDRSPSSVGAEFDTLTTQLGAGVAALVGPAQLAAAKRGFRSGDLDASKNPQPVSPDVKIAAHLFNAHAAANKGDLTALRTQLSAARLLMRGTPGSAISMKMRKLDRQIQWAQEQIGQKDDLDQADFQHQNGDSDLDHARKQQIAQEAYGSLFDKSGEESRGPLAKRTAAGYENDQGRLNRERGMSTSAAKPTEAFVTEQQARSALAEVRELVTDTPLRGMDRKRMLTNLDRAEEVLATHTQQTLKTNMDGDLQGVDEQRAGSASASLAITEGVRNQIQEYNKKSPSAAVAGDGGRSKAGKLDARVQAPAATTARAKAGAVSEIDGKPVRITPSRDNTEYDKNGKVIKPHEDVAPTATATKVEPVTAAVAAVKAIKAKGAIGSRMVKTLVATMDAPTIAAVRKELLASGGEAGVAEFLLQTRDGEEDPFAGGSFNEQTTGESRITAADKKAVAERIKHLLRGLVGDAKFDDLLASGMWDKVAKLITVSNFAKDPLQVGNHEAWHAIEDILMGSPEGAKMVATIHAAVSTEAMQTWLATELVGETKATAQLSSATERAAYAFQFFAAGRKMPMPPGPIGFMAKVMDFLARLSVMITDAIRGVSGEAQGKETLPERQFRTTRAAEQTRAIFKLFDSGQLGRAAGDQAALAKMLAEAQHGPMVAKIAAAVEPVRDLASRLLSHTIDRVRAIKNDSYQEVIDRYVGTGRGLGGFYNAKRASEIRLGNELLPLTKGQLDSKLEAMGKYLIAERLGEDFVENALAALAVPEGANREEVIEAFKREAEAFKAYQARLLAFQKEAGVTTPTTHWGYARNEIGARRAEFVADLVDAKVYDKGEAEEAVSLYLNRAGYPLFFTDTNAAHAKMYMKWAEHNAREALFDAARYTAFTAETRRWLNPANPGIGVKSLLAEGNAKATADEQKLMADFVRAAEGTMGADMSDSQRNLTFGAIALTNAALLPFGLFSQLLDVVGIASRANSLGDAFDAFKRGIKDIPRMFEGYDAKQKKDFWEKYSEDLGIVSAAGLAGIYAEMNTDLRVDNKMKDWNEAFFRYNGMSGWMRSMQVAATKSANDFIVAQKTKPSAHSERFLKELGLTVGDIEHKDGVLVASDKIRNAIGLYVNQAVAHPDPTTNTMWMNDPHFALVAHLKRFTFAFSKMILDRAWDEGNNHKNWGAMLPLVMGVPWMIAVDSVRDFVKPGDEKWKAGWGVWDYVQNGIERAGLLGRGQFISDVTRNVDYGGTGIEGVAGPTVEGAAKIIRGAHNGKFWDAIWNYIPGHQVL